MRPVGVAVPDANTMCNDDIDVRPDRAGGVLW